MKALLTKDQLVDGLAAVSGVIHSKTTLPILTFVSIRSEGDRLHLAATDLDTTITTAIDGQVERQGAVCVPAGKLSAIAKSAVDSEVEVEVNDKFGMQIEVGKSRFKVLGMSPEEFPPIPKGDGDVTVTLPQEQFGRLLRRVSFAVSTDETRYVLMGVLFAIDANNGLRLVATDGRRLALASDSAATTNGEGGFIVPERAVNELKRLVGARGTVDIRLGPSSAHFTITDESGSVVTLWTKLIEGTFPNFNQVIPKECKERVTLNREQLLSAAARVALFTSEKSNSIKLALSKNQLALSACTVEVGEGHEAIDLKYKGKDLAIAFNPDYLTESLQALDVDEIDLELIDELSPGVLKAQDFLYVLMPMRLS